MAPNPSKDVVTSTSDHLRSQTSVIQSKISSNGEKESAGNKITFTEEEVLLFSPDKSTRLLPWIGMLVWPLMLFLPLMLNGPFESTNYKNVFKSSWYEYDYFSGERPKPLGLTLGILCVGVGQIFVIAYFFLHKHFLYFSIEKKPTSPPSIQIKGAPMYNFLEGVLSHLAQPEGFILLTLYLSGTWMFRLMPPSYYSFEGSIDMKKTFCCLATQDCIQYIMHRLEHSVSASFYRLSHKPHHKFTNPRMFDAFNGSMADTIIMILIPLYATALINSTCNVWTYMAFGSMYANWLTLIHSEFPLPWDKFFRMVGFGTPGDHHVHHKFFKYNYGHLFMWYDRICGTYKNPMHFAPRVFSPQV